MQSHRCPRIFRPVIICRYSATTPPPPALYPTPAPEICYAIPSIPSKRSCFKRVTERHVDARGQAHKRQSTNKETYQCTVCEQRFDRKQDIRRHIVIHSDKRPYVCEICNASFKRADHLRPHEKSQRHIIIKLLKKTTG